MATFSGTVQAQTVIVPPLSARPICRSREYLVKQLTEGHVEWTWLRRYGGRPAIQRNAKPGEIPHANDSAFCQRHIHDEFHNLLSTEPQRLSEYIAAPETWNAPPNEPVPSPQKSGLALVLTRARNRPCSACKPAAAV